MATFIDLPRDQVSRRIVDNELLLRSVQAAGAAPANGRTGTRVTVRGYDIPWLPGKAEHMYVEYDDGRERLIARGGPSSLGDALNGSLRVVGGVSPEKESRDYRKGRRVLHSGFLPGVSAQTAAAPARAYGEELKRAQRAYNSKSNSNSFAADVVERMFGVRPGDRLTPGYDQNLRDAPQVRPYDLSPALRGPGG